MLANKPFDAFEVLGGENYYQQNGFQTAIYYDEYRRGNVLPIVGSTDSHNSTENNRNAAICSTIVFAHKNERADILQSIKDKGAQGPTYSISLTRKPEKNKIPEIANAITGVCSKATYDDIVNSLSNSTGYTIAKGVTAEEFLKPVRKGDKQ